MYMPLAAAPTWLSFSDPADHQRSQLVLVGCGFVFPAHRALVMFLRMASQTPPAWQFALSIGLC
jgi:hypothetical protein